MNTKIKKALKRLNSILPLKEKQQACSNEIKELHQNILRSFVSKGRILSLEEMAKQVSNLEEAVGVLKQNDMVVFSENEEPIGAYPFTMEEREHKIQVNEHLVHAMCALDALAVSPMFDVKTHITSQCRVSDDAISIHQHGNTIENFDEVSDVHFGIAWGAADTDSYCATSLCMEMIFLKNNDIATQWLAEDPETREIFNLRDAVEYAGLFFVPLLS